MPSAVLIVASTRAHADAQEILRIQDTVGALLVDGRSVDVLVSRVSPLLSAALDPSARVFTVPRLPFCENVPPRPSLRRLATSVLMFFRAVALTACRDYCVLHGFNDGSIIARAVSRVTMRKIHVITEFHTPFSTPGFFKGPRAILARSLERRALRHADAIILPDEDTLERFDGHLPKARVSLIPDPHAEITPDAFTFGEFNQAIAHVYAYVLRPRYEK